MNTWKAYKVLNLHRIYKRSFSLFSDMLSAHSIIHKESQVMFHYHLNMTDIQKEKNVKHSFYGCLCSIHHCSCILPVVKNGLHVVTWEIYGSDFKCIIMKLILLTDTLSIASGITLWWAPQDFTDNKSVLVEVMAWLPWGTKPLSQPILIKFILPYDITKGK